MARPSDAPQGDTPVVKVRKPRKPSGPREVYAVIQVLNEAGEPLPLHRANVHVVSFEKNARAVLDKIESGEHPNALYLRGVIDPGK